MAAWFSPIAWVAERNNFAGKAARPKRLISPLVGEMSGRTEGGVKGRRRRRCSSAGRFAATLSPQAGRGKRRRRLGHLPSPRSRGEGAPKGRMRGGANAGRTSAISCTAGSASTFRHGFPILCGRFAPCEVGNDGGVDAFLAIALRSITNIGDLQRRQKLSRHSRPRRERSDRRVSGIHAGSFKQSRRCRRWCLSFQRSRCPSSAPSGHLLPVNGEKEEAAAPAPLPSPRLRGEGGREAAG